MGICVCYFVSRKLLSRNTNEPTIENQNGKDLGFDELSEKKYTDKKMQGNVKEEKGTRNIKKQTI